MNKFIDNQLKWAKPMETARAAGHVYDWGDIEKVGVQSKAAADASFGAYATGKPLKATGHDVTEVIELVPAKVIVRQDKREKLACLSCEGELVRAPVGCCAGSLWSWSVSFVVCWRAPTTPSRNTNEQNQYHRDETTFVLDMHPGTKWIGGSILASTPGSILASVEERRLLGTNIRVLDGEFARTPPLHPSRQGFFACSCDAPSAIDRRRQRVSDAGAR